MNHILRTRGLLEIEQLARDITGTPLLAVVHGKHGSGKTFAAEHIGKNWWQLGLSGPCKNVIACEPENTCLFLNHFADVPLKYRRKMSSEEAIEETAESMIRQRIGLFAIDNSQLLSGANINIILNIMDRLRSSGEPVGAIFFMSDLDVKHGEVISVLRQSTLLVDERSILPFSDMETGYALKEWSPKFDHILKPFVGQQELPKDIGLLIREIHSTFHGNPGRLFTFCHQVEIFTKDKEPSFDVLKGFFERIKAKGFFDQEMYKDASYSHPPGGSTTPYQGELF